MQRLNRDSYGLHRDLFSRDADFGEFFEQTSKQTNALQSVLKPGLQRKPSGVFSPRDTACEKSAPLVNFFSAWATPQQRPARARHEDEEAATQRRSEERADSEGATPLQA